MVPGCGQDIVLVDLMSGLSCGAAKCCAPSLYRRSTGNSAAYVALTSLYILGKSINISQRLIANAATKNTKERIVVYLHTTSFMFASLATDISRRLQWEGFWLQERMGSKQKAVIIGQRRPQQGRPFRCCYSGTICSAASAAYIVWQTSETQSGE